MSELPKLLQTIPYLPPMSLGSSMFLFCLPEL